MLALRCPVDGAPWSRRFWRAWPRQTDDHDNEHHHGERNDEQGASCRMGVKLRHQVAACGDDVSCFFFHVGFLIKTPGEKKPVGFWPSWASLKNTVR